MEQDQIAFFSNLIGGSIFLILSGLFGWLWQKRAVHHSLVLAAVVSTVWQFGIATNYQWIPLSKPILLLLEIARDGAWINALLGSLKFTAGRTLPDPVRRVIQGSWLGALVLAAGWTLFDRAAVANTDLLAWAGLVLAVIGIVSVEQLYRNNHQHRLIKLLSITIGSMFVYDLYLFSHSLIFSRIDPDLWYARGGVNTVAGLIMTLGTIAIANGNLQPARFAVSRPVVFYTTSLTVAGSFLALMALGGYYLQIYGGTWGSMVQIAVLFSALLTVAIVAVSRTVRSWLNVWINKHFFHHKYDYRVEWLKLINSLSRPADDENFNELAIRAVAAIFKSPGGAIWLRSGRYYQPVFAYRMTLPETGLDEEVETPFCYALRENEWVFSPQSPEHDRLSAFNELLPAWVWKINGLWLVLPLLTESDLLGFMVLAEPLDASLTWEDLDLLKTVGRQVASYLDRHEAAEMLAESRQFDAFNKLTAFIMHDLKNLIAQQALVVKNAAKHRDNPEFFKDAIHTIDNSVDRMNNLLRKLQQSEPAELRSLELHKVLMEAVKKCKEHRPSPALRMETTDIWVNADNDRLIMTLTHVIKNAQDATEDEGFVDIMLAREGAEAVITVEDNGTGMEEEFVRSQLFRPFVTTKSGRGMGIGAYQTKEFISSLGGSISVESAPGEGTTFIIRIPIAA